MDRVRDKDRRSEPGRRSEAQFWRLLNSDHRSEPNTVHFKYIFHIVGTFCGTRET